MNGNGCIESHKLGNDSLVICLPHDVHLSYKIETDWLGQPCFNVYTGCRNGRMEMPERRRVAIVEPIRHSITERNAGLPEITYNVRFYYSVI